MEKRANNIISFVNESLYLKFSKSTWWIDSGATVHVANSLQGFSSTITMPRNSRRIEVANGVQAEVEAVGDVSLELAGGFKLLLRDVLFVPSCNRNLISVSCLDKDDYQCFFGHGKCAIWSHNDYVGDAFLHDELCLLSLCEKAPYVLNVNEQSTSSNNNNNNNNQSFQSQTSWGRLELKPIRSRNQVMALERG